MLVGLGDCVPTRRVDDKFQVTGNISHMREVCEAHESSPTFTREATVLYMY
jgi:hypothetical protein